MKIEIIKEKLLNAVNHADRISGSHVSLPVLSCIILEAKNNELVVKATNLDVGIEIKVSAKVLDEGVVALSGSHLKAFITGSENSKEVILETKDGVCVCKSGKTVASIKTESSEDFPVIPKVNEETKNISIEDFISGVKSVWWSASISQIKPEISSVYIYEENREMVFVATDSFRLAERRIKQKKTCLLPSLIIPLKNISEIVKTFDQMKDEFSISASKNQISLTAEGIHFSSRLIDGNFPDYKQIIPKEYTTEAVLLKDEFARSIKLAGVFTDNFHQAIFSVLVSKKKVIIKAHSSTIGEVNEELDGSFKGEDTTSTFNQRYLADVLQTLSGAHTEFLMSGAGKAMLIKDAESKGFIYLVMPMNR